MTFTILLIVLAFLALLLLVRVAKGQNLQNQMENPAEHLRSVDLEAFRNLIDPQEAQYLRTRLRPPEFRKIQRQRLRAAIEYVSCAGHNATVLLRLSEAASQSSEPATVAAAERLRENATRLRLNALQATGKLYLAMAFPGASVHPTRVAENYEQMTRQVVMLGLKHPASGVSAAL
jgi:hypothetical protein